MHTYIYILYMYTFVYVHVGTHLRGSDLVNNAVQCIRLSRAMVGLLIFFFCAQAFIRISTSVGARSARHA